MGINSQEVSYGLGQLGSLYATTGAVKPPKGAVIVAITIITATTFTTLDDERSGTVQCVDASSASHNLVDVQTTDEGSGGLTIASQQLPIGVTIYGRWTAATASGGSYIAYLGR
jgi:hypothetical protein